MISAINPVQMTILPPGRQPPQQLALPAPDTVEVQKVLEPEARPASAAPAVVGAYRETEARTARFLLQEGPAHADPFSVPTRSLPKDGLLALHDFAQSPSLTIEPYGDAALAYAQVQGVAGQFQRTVDISV